MSFICREEIWDNFHHHRCNNPAKTAFKAKPEDKFRPVCGIHARRYREFGWIEMDPAAFAKANSLDRN